jgi:hypothetical protein
MLPIVLLTQALIPLASAVGHGQDIEAEEILHSVLSVHTAHAQVTALLRYIRSTKIILTRRT